MPYAFVTRLLLYSLQGIGIMRRWFPFLTFLVFIAAVICAADRHLARGFFGWVQTLPLGDKAGHFVPTRRGDRCDVRRSGGFLGGPLTTSTLPQISQESRSRTGSRASPKEKRRRLHKAICAAK